MRGVVLVGTLTVSIVRFVMPGLSKRLVGDTEAVGPDGETDVVRLTLPAKPLRLVSVRMEESDAPFEMVRTGGEVAME